MIKNYLCDIKILFYLKNYTPFSKQTLIHFLKIIFFEKKENDEISYIGCGGFFSFFYNCD
jgi:hypothetical protein